MGQKTNIQWCDSTVNPSSGCDGCELWDGTLETCYAGNLHEMRLAKSMPDKYAADFSEVRMLPGRMAKAAAWPDLRGTPRPDKPWLDGLPRAIFVGDLGDFMSRGVTDDYFKREIMDTITSKNGSRHFWMLLTKRPSRLAELSEALGGLPDNVMAMTTVTTQKSADIRIPKLLKVRCKWHGLSCEPLLEGIKIDCYLLPFQEDDDGAPYPGTINLVILGGESGSQARPCNVEWIRSLKNQGASVDAPCFVKQLGSVVVAGKFERWLMHHPKGGDMDEWPDDLRVRQFPKGVAR